MSGRSLSAVNRAILVFVAGGLGVAALAGCASQSGLLAPHRSARDPKPVGITPQIAACQRAGKLICDPQAYSAEKFPLAKPDPRGARLLTKQQVLSRYGGREHLRKGETVDAVRMTYRQLHAANPALASATRILVNPSRVMWAITWRYSPPIAYRPCQYASCPSVASVRAIQLSASATVIDALTGQTTDSCTGCAAVPRSRGG